MNAVRKQLILVAVLLGACGGGGGGGDGAAISNTPAPDACGVVEQNTFVDDLMRDVYYWVEELPVIDPADYASPEDTLDALRYDPPDRFSSIRDEEADTAFFSASQFVGVGVGIRLDDDRLFVTQVFGDGPAAILGLVRGDEILAINGDSIADILAGDGVDAAFGADEIGVPVTLRYVGDDAVVLEGTVEKALVTIEPVPALTVLNVAGLEVGYLAFRDFVEPAFDALADAFAALSAAGVDELVLDLRYNGGGLLSVAEFLADSVGGLTTTGQLMYTMNHNPANATLDRTVLFRDATDALDLSRLIVITSGATASASELIVNSLSPYLNVTLIGSQTFGKPVGSYGFTFCGNVINPIAFALENANGEGGYFDGFAPDCEAEDDLTHELGDPEEASLAEAVFYLETGMCSDVAAAKASRDARTKRAAPAPTYGWRELTGAY